jgi:hypothetical protein
MDLISEKTFAGEKCVGDLKIFFDGTQYHHKIEYTKKNGYFANMNYSSNQNCENFIIDFIKTLQISTTANRETQSCLGHLLWSITDFAEYQSQ